MKDLIKYAWSFVGAPYIWGGDDPSGWDCSGVVQEILASVGLQPSQDMTADGLYRHFLGLGVRGIKQPGALVFYGTKGRIRHIGFMIGNARMIEAGGGGSKTKTPEDAAKHNAYVRVRSIYNRTDLVDTILPPYHNVGLSY